ncbi:4'-phosphopantetheinyl transferase family protein [Chelativorans salis]|uniref:4'-phosphopantetheinyl transferase superfamily protein n=1 Tax=Chelativorans salis TaxID=2978478 RepID=A0ABT2LQB3_9HYPH|nr:4'-phosphopantetheinyl transferase superfamily protein [Chelativorans sp. EGI FJ00035]MCT7375573.1 4'-phosphopantetheinyl transferase superfamily protein [Chelativorans sp. EGI FJ00035]
MRYRPLTIGPDIVDIWRWPLDVGMDDLPRYVTALSDGEFARASRFVHERDRLRFIVGRGKLREIIGRYLGVPARRLSFAYNVFGKPRLAVSRPPLHFNLSHAAGMAVLAVSDRYHVGIDIEKIVPLKEDVAGHFFSPSERLALRGVRRGNYLEAFYRCWTRKEAFVKAHGAGLSLPLEAFDVSIDSVGEPRLLRLEGDAQAPAQWRLLNLALPAGFVGAMAALTADNDVSLHYRTDETAESVREEMPLAARVLRASPDNQLLNRASRM